MGTPNTPIFLMNMAILWYTTPFHLSPTNTSPAQKSERFRKTHIHIQSQTSQKWSHIYMVMLLLLIVLLRNSNLWWIVLRVLLIRPFPLFLWYSKLRSWAIGHQGLPKCPKSAVHFARGGSQSAARTCLTFEAGICYTKKRGWYVKNVCTHPCP